MQFSLLSAMVAITTIAAFCATAIAFPAHTQFVTLMLALLLVAFLPYIAGQGGMVLLGISERPDIFPFPSTAFPNSESPTLARAGIVFIFSTVLFIAIYPLACEIGCSFSLLSFGVDGQRISLESEYQHRVQRLSSTELWRILYVWGSIHVAKWTVFFASITFIIGLTSAGRVDSKQLFSRVLYFSPWLIVLHFLMLVGVWIDEPNVSGPEDTGWFLACCIEPRWLKRLAIPMMIVGYVYFTYVLRISFKYAILLAVILIPLAVMVTVAANELGFLLV